MYRCLCLCGGMCRCRQYRCLQRQGVSDLLKLEIKEVWGPLSVCAKC